MELKELISIVEKVQRKVVYRSGKRMIKKKTDKAGFKTKDGREVKMSAREKIKRAKGAKRAAKKKMSKQGIISRKRQITMKKRHD